MSALSAVDRIVTDQAFTTALPDDDPLTRLFIDQTLPCGLRLLAMAEPVHGTPQGFLTSATALIAFEEAFAVAAPADVEAGIERAFAAANAAVRAANRATTVNHRAFAGITAVVIDGCEAIIGLVPPGQVLIIQDERLYGVPDLASWTPDFVPQDAQSTDPLGLNPQIQPQIRRTRLAGGDQFVLGTSAVGRVLARGTVSRVADLPNTVVVDQLEQALEESGIEGAYAAWIRVDAEPVTRPVAEARMSEIEHIWRGERAGQAVEPVVERREAPAHREPSFDRFHDRLIEASERLLARREPETLPYDARRRADTPLGAASLHRYRAPSPLAFGPSFRCRLPRGPRIPLSKRSLLALLLAGAILISSVLGYNVRQARADKQDVFLNEASAALERAQLRASADEALQLLLVAREALDDARANGADEAAIAELRDQVARAEDRFAGISRLSGVERLGALPGIAEGASQLVLAGPHLYLISTEVFLVDTAGTQLIPVLTTGEKVDRIKVGEIISATVDGSTLIVTDGKSIFGRDSRGRWSSDKLAASGSEGWRGLAYGAFQGSFYILDRTAGATIRKFTANNLDDAPANWLKADEPVEILEQAVDMAVDGSIHVLTDDGVVHSFHKGETRREYKSKRLSKRSAFVGIDGGTSGSYLFVLEVYRDDARVIRYERGASEVTAYLPLESSHLGYNAEASAALATATDFAVDEAAGRVYFITADGIWQASLT
ncbi:MAG: hypothetical protein IT336_08150 [Thermomicrobiales bacterium]|nr:hypothetical protein [Thermomicrobiales bacterium]